MSETRASEIDPEALVAVARGLAPVIKANREAIERERDLPAPVMAAMVEAGLFRLYLPRRFGGLEVDPITFNRVVQEVARLDGSVGWNLMVGATYGALAAFLSPAAAEQIYSAPDVVLAGTINPSGRAVVVPGGYRVDGRWSYGSGIQHSRWVIGNCIVYDGDEPRPGADGLPEMRIVILPTAECEIHDTWRVSGLRGTGSHDYSVIDRFVPDEQTLIAFVAEPYEPGPLYACPFITIFAASVAAPPLGMARGAIDALVELAGSKTPMGSRQRLRDRPSIQADVARAEGLVGGARAFLFERLSALWARLTSGAPVTLNDRALVRLAGTHAAIGAAQAVDLMYNAGGGTAIYESCPLERHFRDVHAATQHIGVAPGNFEIAGRVLLGLDPGTPRL